MTNISDPNDPITIIRAEFDRETARLERSYAQERQMMRWIVSVTSTLVLVGGGIGVFLFGQSVKEIEGRMSGAVEIWIDNAINSDESRLKSI